MSKILCFAAFLLFGVSVFGEAEVKSFSISVEGKQKLVITGFKGVVELSSVETSQNLRIQIQKLSSEPQNLPSEILSAVNAWLPKVEKSNAAITVRFQEAPMREFWATKGAFEAIPEYKIVVSGAAVPVEIYWSKGVVRARDWKNNVAVTLNSGQAELNRLEGDLKVFIQSGTAMVSEQKGNVTITSYDAKVALSKIAGATEIENFSGVTTADSIDGHISLNSYSGKSRLKDIKGNLNFDMKIGTLDVDDLDGSLRGDNGDGAVKARFASAPDVRVRSNSGTVNLRVPKKYSAQLNVGSNEGALQIPSHIRIQRGQNNKFAIGRLHGAEREGQIFARSQSGSIVVNATE